MKFANFIATLFLLLPSAVFSQTAPSTLVLNGDLLLANRSSLSPTDANLQLVIKRADNIVASDKVYSVIDKGVVPPSGDKHDYMSQAPYWWADPAKSNGLPYIRHDGKRNPELEKISDSFEMDSMINEAEITALAYYFTGNQKFSKHSAHLIRTWFLNAATLQNPNLNFSQGIPGINDGRGIGLIETRELYRVIDASILLKSSANWSKSDHEALKKWFASFLKWMRESHLGKDESDEQNNHGTFYDVQIIDYAIFTGQNEIARQQIDIAKQRIKSQFETNGAQPIELKRTLSWGYVNMNLSGFFTIARLAENEKIELWNFETDGRGIKKAFEWLLPFVRDDNDWTYEQIKPRTFEATRKLFRIAARKYRNPEYAVLARKLESDAFQTAILAIEY